MESTMTKKTIKQINLHNDELSVLSSLERFNRARSVTVGTSFNGTTEIAMRADGKYLWATLQPVEVIELIHQLSASIGCHMHITPRKDFASWRKWNEESLHQNFPPFSNFPPFGDEPKLKTQAIAGKNQPALRSENEQTLATQKTVGRKRTKRAAAAA
jgi:hypothetical protein